MTDKEIEIPVSGEQSMKVSKLLSLCKQYIINPLQDLMKGNTSESIKTKQTYVDVLIRNRKGELLLLERSYNDDFMPGKWGWPGGKLEDTDESELAGAKRELAEETFLTDVELQYLMTVEKDDCRIHYFTGILDIYPFIILDNEEHFRLEFVKPDDIKDFNTILDLDDIFYNKLLPLLPDLESIGIDQEYINEFNDRDKILVQIQKAVSLELLSRGCDSGDIEDDKYLSILIKAMNNDEGSEIPERYKLKSLKKHTKVLSTELLQKGLEKDRVLF